MYRVETLYKKVWFLMKLLTFSVLREGFIGCLLYQSKTSLYISAYLLPQSGSPKYATLYVLIVPIFSWKIQHFCTYGSEKIYTFQRQSFGTSVSLNPLQIDAMKTPVKFSQFFLKNSLFMRFSQNSSSNSNSLLKNNKFSSQLAQKKEWNPFVCVIKAFHSVQT